MLETAYYIYALKDPRTGKPFYIGKGTGIRAWEHAAKANETRKGRRITEICLAMAMGTRRQRQRQEV